MMLEVERRCVAGRAPSVLTRLAPRSMLPLCTGCQVDLKRQVKATSVAGVSHPAARTSAGRHQEHGHGLHRHPSRGF